MSDHLDAPGLKSPNMDARIDICDIYAFQKPGDSNKSILVFNVNPVAPTFADSFAPEAVYELKVDVSRVLIPKDGNPFFQIDRMGRPLVNVVFTKDGDKDTFNRIEPTRDRELFTEKFTDLFIISGRSPENAQQTALSLLPDILDYDYSRPAGYRNGRLLTDDIIDIQLAVLTNGVVAADKVGPHQDLLSAFPYVGPPHLII